jgi:hypothetical protein
LISSGSRGKGPVAGITGTSTDIAMFRAAILLPNVLIVSGRGPINVMPAAAQASANSGRSDRKP